MTDYRFIEPLDVLYLRGNRLFGGAGAYSTAQMPPWPSIAAGAIRSRMLADSGIDFAAFGTGDSSALTRELAESLGTPAHPGTFRLSWFGLARKNGDRIETFLPLPADIVVTDDRVNTLHPQALHPALRSSFTLPAPPLLYSPKQTKSKSGYWLNQAGIEAWLHGHTINQGEHLNCDSALWRTEHRLGIALDSDTRSAAEGMLYTSDTVAVNKGIGCLIGIDGADGLVPDSGLLRFGGDGRAACIHTALPSVPEPDWQRIVGEKRLRVVLTTPGIFDEGWQLPGTVVQGGSFLWHGQGFRTRLVSAAVSRAETISGWDLALRRPKPALKVAPSGSVYWLDEFEGDIQALRNLQNDGLWPLIRTPDRSRQAEGFNRILIAPWARQ